MTQRILMISSISNTYSYHLRITFTIAVPGETYIINHKFNCNDKCLVYLLTYNCCKKYGGQTIDEFRCRSNNYKVIVGNINVVKHVCNNTCMSIFAAATIFVL